MTPLLELLSARLPAIAVGSTVVLALAILAQSRLREAIERQHGLPVGSLPAAAFGGPYVQAVATGKICRAEWIAAAGAVVGSVPAMTAFLSHYGAVDPEMVSLMREIRDSGMPVGLLTNATDTLPDELRWLGLSADFSVVLSSAHVSKSSSDRVRPSATEQSSSSLMKMTTR